MRCENGLFVLQRNALPPSTVKNAAKNQAVAEHSQAYSQQDLQVNWVERDHRSMFRPEHKKIK